MGSSHFEMYTDEFCFWKDGCNFNVTFKNQIYEMRICFDTKWENLIHSTQLNTTLST